jgi:two-component system NarL family sensor kinase
MKKGLLLLLICFGSTLRSQSIDSLRNVVASLPEDTNKVMALHHLYLAFYKADKQPEMLETAEAGLALSQKLEFDSGLDKFHFNKATVYDIMGKGREAIPIFEAGIQIAQRLGEQKAVANYHLNIGAAYYTLGDLDKALHNFLAAYDIFKNLNLQKNLSKVLNNIGIVYRTQGKRDRAEEIYKESLAIKQVLKDTIGMAASYQNLAAVLSTSDREVETIDYLNKALTIYEKNGMASDAAACYSLLGQIYVNFDKLKEAKSASLRAKAFYDKNISAANSSNVYRILGSIAFLEKKFAESESYFLESAKWARQFGQQDRLWDILNELSKTQAQLGKGAAAYTTLREAFSIRDTVVEQNRLSLMEEMQTKFDVTQKDSELKINQLSLQQRTLERNWFIAGACLLGLLSVVIFFGLRSRIQANKKIAAQESALQRQQIVQLEQETKLTALSAMIEGQEKERSRIAADLHDGLGGLLTSVKSHFNALQKPAGTSQLLSKTNQLLDDACGEVRRISHNMMPRALTLSGLPGALEDLAQDLEKQGVRCQLEIHGMDTPLEPTTSVTLYRIIQELTNNVVKHAQADHLLLQLIRREDTLTIIAEDNGKGFDVQQAKMKKGLGLSSIESRVKFLQGTIEWDSVLGEGTVVSCKFQV